MLTLEQFKGIIPALITPYDHEGRISESATRKLVRHLLDNQVDGFYLSGSTGEGFLQTARERESFLEIVVDEVQGVVPVIAHVGAMDTATCIELTKHAARSGADAVSSVAPFYYKHGQEQVRGHYLDIAAAADIPLIIYHFPAMTGVQSTVRFYEELSKVENIIGVKFTSKDTFELQQLIEACGPQFRVFNGPDECLLAGLALGCCGAIGSTYNIMPKLFIELYRTFQIGDLIAARALQAKANSVIAELIKYDFIAFEREVLHLQGIEVGAPRKPIQQLSMEERLQIRQFAQQYDFLKVATNIG
ncbi:MULTISPECIES: dihydrodipicolinate synthase family protein [unclassified Paenibacillus]|uniref:dihydrodipicolinate synthase family protein n=1 Tax=unclassified Paenibacillus TaxID=185978 RepID=UPI000838C501|nr:MULTISPECIES: dihydrodipicolinate synthase family protein [unclassified Paenibacillus]NWL88204.1 N-acetylneuraminate lyase [Paenibacillus sp. 79R4]